MDREFQIGDLVTHSTMSGRDEYRLGLVLRPASTIGLVKVRWSDGHISQHVSYMLKWIA